jgi:molybdopterin-guanine dinucleotide biosynthesis protein A
MSKPFSTKNVSDPSPRSHRARSAAAILAGGRARRFHGTPKPLLQFTDGKTILEQTICELRKSVFGPIVLSTNTPALYSQFNLDTVADIRPGAGPAGGIEAVLGHLQESADTVLFVPGDAPAFTSSSATALLDTLLDTSRSVPAVFAEADGVLHPTFVAVRTSALEQLTEQLDCGVRKMIDIWDDLGAHTMEFDDPTPFININTEEDWHDFQWADCVTPHPRASASTSCETPLG